MPAIWVINPVCLSQGWGLMWAVIALGLGETSGVIIKGVVSPRANTTLLVSSPVNMAITHNSLPFFVVVTIIVTILTLEVIRQCVC
jgi:hypothetical protein